MMDNQQKNMGPFPIPPSLAAFCDTVLPLLHRQADGRRILNDVADVVATDRWNSFDRFRETGRTLVGRYEAAGAKAEVYPIQTGGAIDTGRWVIREAADVLGATVDIVHPVRERLLDHTENPWHVIQWSAGTPREGVTAELIVVDSIEELGSIPDGGLTGRMVLTRMTPRGWLRILANKGALGVITDFPQPHLPEATAWIKFGWGGIPRSEGPARRIGLVLSESKGRHLRALMRRHGTLRLHLKVDVRKYVGSHDLISGLIPGRDDPQDEVWALAHSAEPGAVDNASGVALCLEIARIIEGLIAAGRLPRPRRSIRLLNGYECYSFFHYMEHVKRFQTPLAGVCLDTLGARPAVCDGRLSWRATLPMSAGFVDRVGEILLRATLGLNNPGYTLHPGPFVSTSDTLAGDPKYGFPCPWLTTHYLDEGVFHAYHSSADTIELLSPEGLAACATATAGYLYYLAEAGSDEAMELATMETARTTAILRAGVKNPEAGFAPTTGQTRTAPARRRTRDAPLTPAEAAYLREAHHVSIRRLTRWLWGGDRAAILAHLTDCERRVREAAEALEAAEAVGRREASYEASCEAPGADRVPYRTAFLAPTAENMPEDVAGRLEAARLSGWALFWADGRRTLAGIASALSCENQGTITVEQVAACFEALAEAGYVKLIERGEMITEARLVDDLKALGLSPGMDVMVHSALSSIGYVAGGADTVVDALLTVIRPGGTLLMPSFNHRAARVYNPMTTPTTNGAIPDAMWRRPEAVRSLHATHAVAAIGPKAETYCRDHLKVGIWAPESPIGRLVHGGGHILSIGVTHDATTAYHVAETSVPCGCIDPFGNTDYIVDAGGAVREVPGLAFRSGLCPMPPVRLHDTLDERGLERYGRVGHARCSLVRAIDLWRVRREHLKDVCPACTITPNIRAD